MDSESHTRESAGAVFARDFNGKPKYYLRIAIAAGLYLGLGVYLVYALILYWFAGDASAFSIEGLLYVGLFCVVYIPWSYRVMMRYDGQLSSGGSWEAREATVKLVQRKEHRRFG